MLISHSWSGFSDRPPLELAAGKPCFYKVQLNWINVISNKNSKKCIWHTLYTLLIISKRTTASRALERRCWSFLNQSFWQTLVSRGWEEHSFILQLPPLRTACMWWYVPQCCAVARPGTVAPIDWQIARRKRYVTCGSDKVCYTKIRSLIWIDLSNKETYQFHRA